MKNIALEFAKTADTILNGLIFLVLVYFVLLCVGIAIREFRGSLNRRKLEARKPNVRR